MMQLKTAPLDTPLPLFYIGPDLEEGCHLPCVIYLALSAKETLLIDPFNQPAAYLHPHPLRVFSVDLPFHGESLPATEGMKRWAEEYVKGNDLLSEFLDKLESSLNTLFTHINPSQVAIMGLSRGGFIASHIAARIERITKIALYAPLTYLPGCLEFADLKESPLVEHLNLSPLTPLLAHKKIKVLIGNRDLRVSTDLCYQWIRSLVDTAFSSNIKSAPIEMALKPSIGYMGHGTSKETFEEGALWILSQLGLSP